MANYYSSRGDKFINLGANYGGKKLPSHDSRFAFFLKFLYPETANRRGSTVVKEVEKYQKNAHTCCSTYFQVIFPVICEDNPNVNNPKVVGFWIVYVTGK